MVVLQGRSTSTARVVPGPGLEHRGRAGVIPAGAKGKLPVESALGAAVQICPKLSLTLGLNPSFH